MRLVFALLTLLWVPAALAAPLSPADRDRVAAAEAYLNSLDTLQARFLQTTPDGGVWRGTLSLDRPGLMRFEYDPPSPLLIVADGHFLFHYDSELDEMSSVPLGETPADLFVRENVRLDGDLAVADVTERNGLLEITVYQADAPEEGAVTLVFTTAPMALRKWTVTDETGQTTDITLTDVRTGMDLDGDMFTFHKAPRVKPD